ncbi:MAG: hypothetical protein HWE34_14770, partial [Methylocystaceae bacterium]|nr:hypothetical protein [Methylocystaceae bacterium]
NQPFQGVSGTASGNSAVTVLNPQQIAGLAGNTVAALPGSENLLPPSVQNAVSGGENGQQQNIPSPDVQIDQDTADALQDSFENVVTVQNNLVQSANLAQNSLKSLEAKADEISVSIVKSIQEEYSVYTDYAATISSVATATTAYTITAKNLETLAAEKSGVSTIESAAGTISADWNATTTNDIEFSVDNVMEAYATANAIGSVAAGVTAFAEVVANSIGSLVEPAAAVGALQSAQTLLGDALGETANIIDAMTNALDTTSTSPYQNLSVQERMVQAVIQAAKDVKDADGTDANAILAARNAILGKDLSGNLVSGGVDFVVNGVTYKFLGLQTELNQALTSFGTPNALTNLDGYIADLNTLFTAMKDVDFTTDDAGASKLTAWNAFVDEMITLTESANTAATNAKEVINATDMTSMDDSATAASTAMQDASARIFSSAFNDLKEDITGLVSGEAPSQVILVLGNIKSKALEAATENQSGKEVVVDHFDPTTVVSKENALAGVHVTQADLDEANKTISSAKVLVETAKSRLTDAQNAYSSSASDLEAASLKVRDVSIQYKPVLAQKEVYLSGREEINNGTLYNGTDPYNSEDGSGIDGLKEAIDFLDEKEDELATLLLPEGAYQTAIDTLKTDPTNAEKVAAVLLQEQEKGALEVIITYAKELVTVWQDAYDQANALVETYTEQLNTLEPIWNAAQTAESDARSELLDDLSDLIAAQKNVSTQNQYLSVVQNELDQLENRAEKEAIEDLNDVLGDARTQLDVALAQATLAAQKAQAAAAEVANAKLADDASSYLSNAQTLKGEADDAVKAANAAYNELMTDYARALAIRDYLRPPAGLETTIGNIEQQINSVLSAVNEAKLQAASVAGSVAVIQAIVDGDAAAQAAAESASAANQAAADAQSIEAALGKAQAAQNEISSGAEIAQNYNDNARLIAQKAAGTSAENTAVSNADNVETGYLTIQAKQSLVSAELQAVEDAKIAGDLTAARAHADNAQNLAVDVKALLDGGTLSDGTTNVTGLVVGNQTTGKAVIAALESSFGTKNGATRTGIVDSIHTLKLSSDSQYIIANKIENDTNDPNVESITELFSVGAGESIVAKILTKAVDAQEIAEFESQSGTAYTSIFEKIVSLKSESANALATTQTAQTNAIQLTTDATQLVADARSVLNASQLSGADYTTYSDKVSVMGNGVGIITIDEGAVSANVQRISQIDDAIRLYKELWENRIKTQIQENADRVAAQTAADQAATDASNAAAERTAQKAADDEAATTQAQGFETTAAQQKALAETALANAQEAVINGDEASAQTYLDLVQKYASASQAAAQAASNAAAGHGVTAETAAENARDSGVAAQGYLGDAKAAVTAAADSAASANNWRSGSATQAALQATSDKDEAVTNESNARTNLTNATTSLDNARTAVSDAEIKAASAQAAYNSLVDAKKAAADKAAAILAEVGSDSPIYQAWASAAEAASDAADSALSASQDAAQALTDANSRLSVVQSSYDRALEAATNASEQLADAVSNEAYASSLEDLGRAVSEAQVDNSLSSAQSSLDTALTNLASEKITVEQKAALAAQHAQDDANFDADIVQNAYDDPNSTNDAVGSLADAQTAKASADAALVVAQNALAKYYVDLSVIKSANDPNVAIDGGSIVDFASYTNQDWVRIDDSTVISGSTYDKYVAAQASIELASKKADQAADALQTV